MLVYRDFLKALIAFAVAADVIGVDEAADIVVSILNNMK